MIWLWALVAFLAPLTTLVLPDPLGLLAGYLIVVACLAGARRSFLRKWLRGGPR
jgi:hypothetical protein